MSNLHRLAWIDDQIRRNRFPGCRSIAEKFEISVRQAQRDIEYLKYSMGAPLEYSADRRGYCYSDETFTLPSHCITGEEKRILTYLASQYRTIRGGNAGLIADLFSRLSDSGTGTGTEGQSGREKAHLAWDSAGDITEYHEIDNETSACEVFRKAIGIKRKVRLTYRNYANERSERVYHPYKLFVKDGVDYVAGYCELRSEIRVLRLSRVCGLGLLEESFEVLGYFNEKAYGPQKGFLFKEPYTATVAFGKPVTAADFKFEAIPVGNDTFKFKFHDSGDLLSELLSAGYPFTVLFPGWLRRKLRDRLDEIIKRNL